MINSVTIEGFIIRKESLKLINGHSRIEFDISTFIKNDHMEMKCKAFDSNAELLARATKGNTVVMVGYLEPLISKSQKQTGIVISVVSLKIIDEYNPRGILDHVNKAQSKVHQLED